jgi:serine/threonine-protein kinase
MQVLVRLAHEPGRVVTRQELLDTVWGDTAVGEQVLSRAVSELRKVFEDDSRTPRVIETIAKSGYRLLLPVQPVADAGPEEPEGPTEMPVSPARGRRVAGLLGYLLTAVAAAAVSLIAVWIAGPGSTPSRQPRPMTLSMLLPGEAPPILDFHRSFDLSPDGKLLVYSGGGDRRQLFARRLDLDEVEAIPGTEGGYGPFFSHDGRQLGFYAAGKLRRVPLDGGDPVTLYPDASDPMGASWGEDGTLVFARRMLEGLWIIPPGGAARQLTELRPEAGERSHFWPYLLPGGERLLFTVWHGGSIEGCDVEILDLTTGERRLLLRAAADARYLDGRLLFARAGRLTQAAFDERLGQVTGPEITVMEELLTHPVTGAGHFAVASNGTLVSATSGAIHSYRSLLGIDSTGLVSSLGVRPGPYGTPRLAPDGQRLAVTSLDYDMQVWLLDLERGGAERLTREGYNFWPLWGADGARIVFSSSREGAFNLFVKEARGAADAERLTESANLQMPGSWSPDGRLLAYSEFHPDSRWDIWLLAVGESPEPRAFLVTPFDEFRPEISPDGRLVAYISNEAGRWDERGRWEIFVRPLDEPETRIQVSTEGGIDPLWAKDGQRLFYRQGDRLMGAEIAVRPTLAVGETVAVAAGLRAADSGEGVPLYDLGPDGRFIVVGPGDPTRPTRLKVSLGVLNEE